MSAATSLCRCPACNPLHGQASGLVRGGGRAGKGASKECPLCGDTKLVEVDVARRFLEHLHAFGNSTTGKPYPTAASTPQSRSRWINR